MYIPSVRWMIELLGINSSDDYGIYYSYRLFDEWTKLDYEGQL